MRTKTLLDTVIEIEVLKKVEKNLETMNIARASDPKQLAELRDNCFREVLHEIGASTSIEIPEVHPARDWINERIAVHKAERDSVAKKPELRAIPGGKAKKAKPSKERLAQLDKVREAYFRKMGYGKFAKRAAKKKPAKRIRKKRAA